MKAGSTGSLVLAITWIIISLVWFLWAKNIAVGVIWLCAGIFALVIALVKRRNK